MSRLVNRFVTGCLTLSGLACVRAEAAPPLHSRVEARATPMPPDKVEITYHVPRPEGLTLNDEGRWTLEVVKADGLLLDPPAAVGQKIEAFERSPERYSIKVVGRAQAPQGQLLAKLVAFVCTADKKHCYRDVHNVQTPWTQK